jgi:hypothetical protein
VLGIVGGSRNFLQDVAGNSRDYGSIAADFVDDMEHLSGKLNVPVVYLGMPNPSADRFEHPGPFIMEMCRAINSKRSPHQLAIRDVATVQSDLSCVRSNDHEFEELAGYRERHWNRILGKVIHSLLYYDSIHGFEAYDAYP